MTIVSANERQQTRVVYGSQITYAAALVARTVIWLRDQEANASGANVADETPTELP